jgi:hypothetical protein
MRLFMADLTASKLAFRLKQAFAVAKATGKAKLETLPSGLNCKVRFTSGGAREILCYRSGKTPPSDKGLEVTATHAGFIHYELDCGVTKTGLPWAVISELDALDSSNTDSQDDDSPPWELEVKIPAQAQMINVQVSFQKPVGLDATVEASILEAEALSPTERAVLLEKLCLAAYHTGETRMTMRRAVLEQLSDAALATEAKTYCMGSVWKAFEPTRENIRASESAFDALGRDGLFNELVLV